MFTEYFMLVITSILILLPFILLYLRNKHKEEVKIERLHSKGYTK